MRFGSRWWDGGEGGEQVHMPMARPMRNMSVLTYDQRGLLVKEETWVDETVGSKRQTYIPLVLYNHSLESLTIIIKHHHHHHQAGSLAPVNASVRSFTLRTLLPLELHVPSHTAVSSCFTRQAVTSLRRQILHSDLSKLLKISTSLHPSNTFRTSSRQTYREVLSSRHRHPQRSQAWVQ